MYIIILYIYKYLFKLLYRSYIKYKQCLPSWWFKTQNTCLPPEFTLKSKKRHQINIFCSKKIVEKTDLILWLHSKPLFLVTVATGHQQNKRKEPNSDIRYPYPPTLSRRSIFEFWIIPARTPYTRSIFEFSIEQRHFLFGWGILVTVIVGTLSHLFEFHESFRSILFL